MKLIQLSKNIQLALIAILALSLSSCVGPSGPRGPVGEPGRDGNANVVSINYTAVDADWYDVGTSGTVDYFLALDFDVPEITQDIVDNGLVLVYYREDDQSSWKALPYTVISHDPEYIEKIDVIYDFGFVGIQSKASDLNANSYEGTFRIIVAAAVPINKTAMDYSNYEAVVSWLEITDADQVTRVKKK